MKDIIDIEKKRVIPYLILACALYAALGIIGYTMGVGDIPVKYLPTLFIMPAAIMFMGILDFKFSDRAKKIITLFFIIYLPLHLLNFVLGNNTILIHGAIFYNYTLCASVVAFFLFVTLNLRITSVVVCIIFFAVLSLNTWVAAFRGNAITPADVLALGTAIKVSGGYDYFISMSMFSSVMYSIIIIQLIFKLCYPLRIKKIYLNLGLRLVFLIVAIALPYRFVTLDKYWSNYGYYAFDVTKSNRDFGVLTTFLYNLKKTGINEPEGYDKDKVRQILESTEELYQPKPLENKPNVIVIMNEAFADLEKIYDIEPNEDPLKYWHSLKENTISGDMRVSIYGGGTSFTEFEFLTGIAGGIINFNQTPFINLINHNIRSIAWDLKESGYKTIAVHPFWSSSWNRSNVYPLLGFDDFISGEDFSEEKSEVIESTPDGEFDVNGGGETFMYTSHFGDDLEYIRGYISDRESYKKVIEQFENKNEDDRLFIFNVTVQNHAGFHYEGDDFVTDVKITDEENIDIDQYLSLAKQSDIAYGELIEYFKNYDEPTIILMFGDHQPSLVYTDMVDEEDIKEEYKSEYNSEQTYKYIVPYKLWANFDIGTAVEPMTGSSFLSLLVKDKAGIEFNKWDQYRLKLKNSFQAINSFGIFSGDGKLMAQNTDETDSLIKEYELLEYYILNDEDVN